MAWVMGFTDGLNPVYVPIKNIENDITKRTEALAEAKKIWSKRKVSNPLAYEPRLVWIEPLDD